MERLMQYVWMHRLWPAQTLRTIDRRPVTVIDQGTLNTGAGPDFFNAKVRIGEHVWVGDVEIHVRASDWHRHGHDDDPAYNSVILHVVDRDDVAIKRPNGETIPQMRLPCEPEFYKAYAALVNNTGPELACARLLPDLDRLYVSDWITSLALERIYEKTDRILELLERSNGDWQHACYVTLARSFGFGTNAEPMERLARSAPLRILYKHSDSLISAEAYLLGQAGLLESVPQGIPYAVRLQTEYRFLASKFGLKPLDSPNWRIGGMRPTNSPYRRIALLANLLALNYTLLDDILAITTPEDARRVFDIEMHGFWRDNYSFNTPPAGSRCGPPRGMSFSTLSLLIINAVIPLITARGLQTGDSSAIDRAISLLESMRPEHNSIISLFERAGIKVPDALTSQALIRLRRHYCEPRKCLYCRFGHRMLAAKALRPEP